VIGILRYFDNGTCSSHANFLLSLASQKDSKKGKKKGAQKLKCETGDSWKAWNVALTRARNKMILCRSYDIKDLQTCDFRQKVLRKFLKPGKAIEEPKSLMLLESAPLTEKVEAALSGELKRHGYLVEKKGGAIWGSALCVDSPVDGVSHCALVGIENAGESEEEWTTMVDQQQSLERAGRACLRVDCLSLALNFPAAFEDVLVFLEKSRLPKPAKRNSECPGTSIPSLKKPRTE